MAGSDGLFAQPQYPASTPRVRSFAERALKEIRSGEGENSLLCDRKAFSEFMYRVTESVLLGHVDPPTSASIFNGEEYSSHEGRPSKNGPSESTNAAQDPSTHHLGPGETREWNNARQQDIIPPPYSSTDMQHAMLGGPARSPSESGHGAIGKTTSSRGGPLEEGDERATPDSATEGRRQDTGVGGPSLLEELRRWRSLAGKNHVAPAAPPPPESAAVTRSSPTMLLRPPVRPTAPEVSSQKVLPSPKHPRPNHSSHAGTASTLETSVRASDDILTRTPPNCALEERVESETRPCVDPRSEEFQLCSSGVHGGSFSSTENLAGKVVDGSENASGRTMDHMVERSPNLASTRMRRFLDEPRDAENGGFSQEHERVDCKVDLQEELRETDRGDQRRDTESVIHEQGEGNEGDPLEMSLDLSDCSDEKLGRAFERGHRR